MKRLLLIVLLLAATNVFAQKNAENSLVFDFAAGNTQGTLAFSYTHDWLIGARKKIVIGIGGRFTGYAGRNKYYITAPAQLTSGGTGPLVIFKENIVANIDTFLVAKPNVYALNAMINLGYRFNEKLQVGFNIDAVGFSFGGERRGNYINGPQGRMVDARATAFNALLISDNDIGTLNSELYGSYALNDRWSVRVGAQFLFTEYTTLVEVQQSPEPNDRFRNKSLMFMIGTSFKLK